MVVGQETSDDANLAFGRRLKGLREQLGLSQQRLAAMIRTSQSCISLWENGINGASIACFFQLADALQVDARWLATGRAWSKRPTPRLNSAIRTARCGG